MPWTLRYSILVLFTLSISLCYSQARRVAFFGSSGVQNIMICGQSNIGSENTAQKPADIPTANPATFIFFESLSWQPMVIGTNSSFVGKFGPEARLGKLLTDHFGRSIYFFKSGTGGVPLVLVAGEDWNTASATELYVEMVDAHELAIATIPTSKKKFDWFIWIQGEQDCSQDAYANAYGANITSLITQTRIDTGNPDLKFILTSLSSNQNLSAARRDIINAAMEDRAQFVYNNGVVTEQSGGSVIEGVWYVVQNGTVQADLLHYDAAAFDDMGEFYFDIMVNYN